MEEVLCFYLHLYDRLWKHVNPTKIIAVTDAKKLLGRAYNIPDSLRFIVLKEMEFYKLIKFVNRRKIKLIKKPRDIANNTREANKRLKVF